MVVVAASCSRNSLKNLPGIAASCSRNSLNSLPDEGPESLKTVSKWCPGELRGCQNEVPGGPGTSRGGPGTQGVPSGAPGLDFGFPRALFGVSFWSVFWHVFAYFFGTISASVFDAVLESPVFFFVILETFRCPKFLIKSVTFQRTSPGAPSQHHSVKKLDFHGSVV